MTSIDIKRQERKKQTGEDFTPPKLVNEILDHLPETAWTELDDWLDPTAGNGNFLVEVKRRLMENNHNEVDVLNHIYGVDLMMDNCIEMIERLYGYEKKDIVYISSDKKQLPKGINAIFFHIIERNNKTTKKRLIKNIVCADGLEYDYQFDHSSNFKSYKPSLFDKVMPDNEKEVKNDIHYSVDNIILNALFTE